MSKMFAISNMFSSSPAIDIRVEQDDPPLAVMYHVNGDMIVVTTYYQHNGEPTECSPNMSFTPAEAEQISAAITVMLEHRLNALLMKV